MTDPGSPMPAAEPAAAPAPRGRRPVGLLPWFLIGLGALFLASAGVVIVRARRPAPARGGVEPAAPQVRPPPVRTETQPASPPPRDPRASAKAGGLSAATAIYLRLLQGGMRKDPPSVAAAWRLLADAFRDEGLKRLPVEPAGSDSSLDFYRGLEP